MRSFQILGLLRLMYLLTGTDSVCPPESNFLTLDPPVLIIQHDEPVEVNCTTTVVDHYGIYWRIGNVNLDEAYRPFILLSEAKLDWNAKPQCRIMLSDTDECVKDLEITMYKKPDNVIVYPISNGDPVEGMPYELQCDINSVAPVQNLIVTWYKNNQTTKTEYFNKTTKTPESESSNLTLNMSREENGTEFTCEARLDLGPDGPQPPTVSSNTHTISVHYGPEFKDELELDHIDVNKNSDVSLKCEAEGNPPPKYIWTKDGVTLSDDTEYLNLTQVNANTTYNCTASNYIRRITKIIHVYVTETATTAAPDAMATLQASDPKDCPLTLTPAEIVVRYGDPASVNCSTSSTDAIGIGWEGAMIENAPDVIWTVQKLEDWNMNPVCFITLKDYTQCQKIPKITLYKTPDVVSVSASDDGPMLEGLDYQLICDIINVAPVNNLEVKWYRNNETLKTETINDTSVTPKNVSSILKITPEKDDNGANFTCVAELHLGPNGPQPVPPETSEPYIAVVHCPVTLTPAEIVVRYGDPASVNCNTSVKDAIGMGWEAPYGGRPFTHVSDVTWAVEKLEDWNIYPLCYITLKNNLQCQKNAKVTVYKTPDVVSVSALDFHDSMLEGLDYQLICNIINVAPVNNLEVKWYRNNEALKTEMFNDTSVTPKNVFSILRVTPEKDDNGANFTCVAELHLGPNGPQPVPTETSEPYIAVVHYKPLSPACPVRYGGKEREFSMNMVLCEADGNPPPTVQWYYQETLINASELLTRNRSGRYRAEAVNKLGSSSTSVDITVEYGPSFSCNGRYEVEENGNLHSKCEPEGMPKPDIVWFKDGTQMASPQLWKRHDSGKYFIIATNKHGQAKYTLDLDVLYAPEFKEENASKELIPGENITLDCSAEGNPSPKIQWYYPHEVNVKNTTRGHQSRVSVIGATSTNAGVYICGATNKVGHVTRTVTLIMKDQTSTIPQRIILLLISLLIIFLLIIIMVIFCTCKKKHGQYNFVPPSDTMPLSARSNGVHT